MRIVLNLKDLLDKGKKNLHNIHAELYTTLSSLYLYDTV